MSRSNRLQNYTKIITIELYNRVINFRVNLYKDIILVSSTLYKRSCKKSSSSGHSKYSINFPWIETAAFDFGKKLLQWSNQFKSIVFIILFIFVLNHLVNRIRIKYKYIVYGFMLVDIFNTLSGIFKCIASAYLQSTFQGAWTLRK